MDHQSTFSYKTFHIFTKSLFFVFLRRGCKQFGKLFITFPHSLPAITCSKLTIEVLEQGMKYVQS